MISNFLRRRSNRFYPGCILFGLALGVVWAFQASGDKVVYCNAPAQITDPVMITNVTVEGKSVDCGLFVKPPAVVQSLTPFPAGSDWLQTMTISMINRTNKIIVFGQITLVFLDTGDCRAIPCVAENIHLGQIPATDAYDGKTGKPLKKLGKQPLDWKPDQVLTVHVDDYMNEIETQSGLTNFMPVTAVSKVRVDIGAVYFQYGMRWSGWYYLPDPERHGKFNHLPYNYFPGKRAHNWPPGYDR